MPRWACCLLVVAACGDNAGDPVPPVENAGCREVPFHSLDDFSRSADLGPVVPRTLEGWDPAGRWFFTDALMSPSTIWITPAMPGHTTTSGQVFAPSATELFATFWERPEPTSPKFFIGPYRITERIANLRGDGSLRYDHVFCREKDMVCDVCTARMIRAERHDPTEGKNLTLLGELPVRDFGFDRNLFDVDVFGTTAYLVGDTGLAAVDVTDPAHPVVRGTLAGDVVTRWNDVAIVEANTRRYAIIAHAPVQLVDVTNADDLQPAGQLPVEAHTLFAETRDGKTLVYFGSLDGTCPVYDFTDPLHPVRLGVFDTHATYVHDLSVANGIAYLNAWELGFFVVDYTDPTRPVLLGHSPAQLETSHANWTTVVDGRRVAVVGEETYGAHATVLDVEPRSPTFMQPLAEWQTREYVSIHNFTGVGTKTYFTYYQDGVRVLDLADPSHPVERGYFNTWDPQDPDAGTGFFSGAIGLDLDVARKLVFVADIRRGLLILSDGT
jgi:hypothetical protein